MTKVKPLLLIIFLSFQTFSVSAFEAANPYWMALKPKLKAHLEKTIDKKKYSYTIYGPSRDLKSFLGKSKKAEIRFSNLNLQSPSMRKTVVASAYDNTGKKLETLPIYIDVKIYKEVLTLKRPINKGEEITPDNIQKTVIAIDPRNARTYYDPNKKLAQKVANNSMAAGAAIRFNQVRHEKLIHVGDSIKVANKNKVIVLEFMCRAMKSGDIGDIITVSCPDLQSKSKKARIVDETHAEFV
jgi:flagella basal body P-ring formation protein FlgA